MRRLLLRPITLRSPVRPIVIYAAWASKSSSTLSRPPSALVALWSVCNVTEGFSGSSKRSKADRLVSIRLAISALLISCPDIFLAISKAIYLFTATAVTSSSSFFFKKIVEVVSQIFCSHHFDLSFVSRRLAVDISFAGIFCDFFINPYSNTIGLSRIVKKTWAMPNAMRERNSQAVGQSLV